MRYAHQLQVYPLICFPRRSQVVELNSLAVREAFKPCRLAPLALAPPPEVGSGHCCRRFDMLPSKLSWQVSLLHHVRCCSGCWAGSRRGAALKCGGVCARLLGVVPARSSMRPFGANLRPAARARAESFPIVRERPVPPLVFGREIFGTVFFTYVVLMKPAPPGVPRGFEASSRVSGSYC